MNSKELEEKVKKFKIGTEQYISDVFCCDVFTNSAKEIRDKIDKFLQDNGLDDAKLSFDTDDYDGRFYGGISLSGTKPKTKEQLIREVELCEEVAKTKRKNANERRKQNQQREYQLYLELEKKYGKK